MRRKFSRTVGAVGLVLSLLLPPPASSQTMAPLTDERGERACGYQGVPQLRLNGVYLRQAGGAQFITPSSRDGKGNLTFYFQQSKFSADSAVTANVAAGAAVFKIYFPKRNSAEFKSFRLFVNNVDGPIQKVGIWNLNPDDATAEIKDPAARVAFAKSLVTANTVTFVSTDAAGKELTRDSYEVSGFARALRLLDGSRFMCTYPPEVTRSITGPAIRKLQEILGVQPLEIDYNGVSATITAISGSDCSVRFDLGAKGAVMLPFLPDFSTAHESRNDSFSYLSYGGNREFRIFAAGKREQSLAPAAKSSSTAPNPLAALFGSQGMGQRKSRDPSAAQVGALVRPINEVIETCHLR